MANNAGNAFSTQTCILILGSSGYKWQGAALNKGGKGSGTRFLSEVFKTFVKENASAFAFAGVR